MSNQENRPDTYDVLHRNFSLFEGAGTPSSEESDVKNSGEIYFSAGVADTPSTVDSRAGISFASGANLTGNRGGAQGRSAARQGRTTSTGRASSGARSGARSTKTSSGVKKSTSTGKRGSSSKKGKKKKDAKTLILPLVVLVFVILSSLLIRIPLMGCISDILAINRDSHEIRVILEGDKKTKDVISVLGNKNLIYSTAFCKLVSGFLGYESDLVFPAGTYFLRPDMGLEGMLREIITAGQKEATVMVTLPEGFTVDQIFERLAQNGVASSTALYKAMDDDSLYKDYDFLTAIADRPYRYRALEGYLYPDTYEFYVDESPLSVLRRFLDNFESKWNSKFAAEHKDSPYSVDEIMTVASIIAREARDSEQMPLVASILYNRINSSSFPHLDCDSTQNYIDQQKDKLVQEGRYTDLRKVYDTYQVSGLPIGPICNPGADAIKAAISPDVTDYYFFLHDKSGKIYTARTMQEHDANMAHLNDNAD